MKDETEHKSIKNVKKNPSKLGLTRLTYGSRYEIWITHRKKSGKNHEAKGLIT